MFKAPQAYGLSRRDFLEASAEGENKAKQKQNGAIVYRAQLDEICLFVHSKL